MLSLSIFAVAAQAATQPAAANGAAPFARQPQNVVVPNRPEVRKFFNEWGFAEAVIDGDRVWLSGVVAGLRPGESMADADKAYDQAFRMLGDVLKRSGSSFDGVVDITTFHTDLPAQFEGFRKVKDRYIREPFPAWTAIDIDRLVPDGGLVEIKVVARRTPQG
ncbi:RidA family protein [Sphingomonas sp. NSE70-1]|uniref:RidA family protein n=1 Tax=Sphingomonas caseinilyticus TaxID=2908205 RepID=A0ABT0RV53_9SPHN|nr:RidA family protein [Sphingomonas caseinilyticus]MCL6698874.1 RidA family protein [Sphingomonas caseinilyticus]